MNLLKNIALIIFGFSSGTVIAGAVFAFIAIIGVVPRLAQKTKTEKYVVLYEEALILGGIGGAAAGLFCPYLPIGNVLTVILSLCIGVFFGCVAVSLAEILDVIPIMSRRIKIQEGIPIFMCALALGKMLGSLLYFLVPGYYHY